MKKESKALHPDVRIGHVHLKVADLERAIAFYRDVLGFELTQRAGYLRVGNGSSRPPAWRSTEGHKK